MKTLIYPIIVLCVLFLLMVLRYRLARSKTINGYAEIYYKIIDVNTVNYFRNFVESILGNRRIFLANNDIKFIYVNKIDFDKLWPESPLKMQEKNYTMKLNFEVKHLIFGGYSLAKITSYKKINKPPQISK